MTQHYEQGSIPPLSNEKLWETIDIVARGWDEQRQRADGLEATAKINASAAEMWRERAQQAERALKESRRHVTELKAGRAEEVREDVAAQRERDTLTVSELAQNPLAHQVGARLRTLQARADAAETRSAALSTALRSMARRASALRQEGAR